MHGNGMFRKSALIVAHPDDEVLWFSSILDKVDEVVICFLECRSKSRLSLGRKNSLERHPLGNICSLAIEESEAKSANWENPKQSRFGIAMTRKSHLLKRRYNRKYEKNYYELRKGLEGKLSGYDNVFTHNPWGEYGNAEHIQIYRVLKELQREKGFDLWFSNYCSPLSFKLMLDNISGFDSEYLTLKTNKAMAEEIKGLYEKNGCWTWYSDWVWFNEECFKKDIPGGNGKYGHTFPLNMIKAPGRPFLLKRVYNIIRRNGQP